MKPRLSLILQMSCLTALAAVPPLSGQGAGAAPEALQGVTIEQKLNSQVPLDLTFVDENGESVQLARYFGTKPVILTLVYYDCPMLCDLVLSGTVRTLRTLNFTAGNEFEMVTVSFDSRENPSLARSRKAKYLDRYGRPEAGQGWHFLTGQDAEIRKLAESVGFTYRFDEKSGDFAHAGAIMVLTPEGRVARYFYGVEYPPRDLRLALVEASEGRIGSAVDQMLLFCFHYDPLTGRYSLAIMNALRVAGVATVLVLALGLVWMLKRDNVHPRETNA